MAQNRSILNCNNNINCNIWHAGFAAFAAQFANVNAAAIAAAKSQKGL